MAPPFRSGRASKNVRPQYNPHEESNTDPVRIAYRISRDAARVLRYASRTELDSTESGVVNGYVARHLVELGCLKRVEGRTKKLTSYRITLRGEAVVEEMITRKRFPEIFGV